MKLRYTSSSPYVRKVMIVAIENDLEGRIEKTPTNVWAPDTDLGQDNPLGKAPLLITDQGEHLFDSPVICEYLDQEIGRKGLFPASGPARWRALRRQALGDGVLDAALLLRVETVMRPEPMRWESWIDRQKAAIRRSLEVLEAEADQLSQGFSIGELTIVAALGYLDFRFPDLKPAARFPKLCAWAADISERPSVKATVPKD